MISRRSLFALPLVAPLAVPAVVAAASTAPANRVSNRIAVGALTGETIKYPWLADDGFEIDLSEWDPPEWCAVERRLVSRECPRGRDLAATLGIPHEEPHVWTDEEVAATLGINVQRDDANAMAALEQFVDTRSARREMPGDLLDGKGEG